MPGQGLAITSQPPLPGATGLPSSPTTSGTMPGSGLVQLPGLVAMAPGSGAHHDAAGLGLPPGVDDRAAAAADLLVVPHPGLGIDPFADAAQQAQARQVVAGRRTGRPT